MLSQEEEEFLRALFTGFAENELNECWFWRELPHACPRVGMFSGSDCTVCVGDLMQLFKSGGFLVRECWDGGFEQHEPIFVRDILGYYA